ncbi:hypothetical protein SLUN_11740 [Streptomyces lunaelactis]|uniref:Uncharacterized protein n=1 Tax=Streptomyces lunaelactis TaxID=1535768 RepID=A0A2R4T0X5_9ACTN|nr:hypothetical protein SLUN_11740 [Streptomyces lunaelactis]
MKPTSGVSSATRIRLSAEIASARYRSAGGERRRYPHQVGEIQELPGVGVRIRPTGHARRDAAGVLVGPERAHQHQPRPDQAPGGGSGQRDRTVEVALQLVQPHDGAPDLLGRQSLQAGHVGGVGMDQPPLRQFRADRLQQGAGLPHRRIAD